MDTEVTAEEVNESHNALWPKISLGLAFLTLFVFLVILVSILFSQLAEAEEWEYVTTNPGPVKSYFIDTDSKHVHSDGSISLNHKLVYDNPEIFLDVNKNVTMIYSTNIYDCKGNTLITFVRVILEDGTSKEAEVNYFSKILENSPSEAVERLVCNK